jgi:hypothetical protein
MLEFQQPAATTDRLRLQRAQQALFQQTPEMLARWLCWLEWLNN